MPDFCTAIHNGNLDQPSIHIGRQSVWPVLFLVFRTEINNAFKRQRRKEFQVGVRQLVQPIGTV
jgi:hypothetical protein